MQIPSSSQDFLILILAGPSASDLLLPRPSWVTLQSEMVSSQDRVRLFTTRAHGGFSPGLSKDMVLASEHTAGGSGDQFMESSTHGQPLLMWQTPDPKVIINEPNKSPMMQHKEIGDENMKEVKRFGGLNKKS